MNKDNNKMNQETNGTEAEQQTNQPVKMTLRKRWDVFRATKGGRWAIRGGKAVAILASLGFAYEKGKKSVKPEIIYVQPEQPETPAIEEPTEENKEEEPAAAETAE